LETRNIENQATIFGGARLDVARRTVVDAEGRETVLRAKTYDVLAVLLGKPDTVVSKNELFEKVWNSVIVGEDTLVQCVTEIRKAIGPAGRNALRTMAKVGYRLVPDQEPVIAAGHERVLDRPETIADLEMELFRRLNTLTPDEFRRLMNLGKWREVTEPVYITFEGVRPTELYYVVEGDGIAEKSDPNSMHGDGVYKNFSGFVGEVAYMGDQPALTSTKFLPGTKYVSWNTSQLTKLLDGDLSLKNGLLKLFYADMAVKIKRFYNKSK
jgi:DNA-binding winged helix-turn-helix (wHTH) protein